MKEDLEEMQKTIQEAIDKFLKKWFPGEAHDKYVPAEININVDHKYLSTFYTENTSSHGVMVNNIAEVTLTIIS